jgi:non-haem Fe2+, alpha-ketoglutarate-dependent halogenase
MKESLSLTADQLASFDENGFVGPFDLVEADVSTLRGHVDSDLLAGESPIYGLKSGRDWHLESPTVYDVCTNAAITERVASLLGPDLLLWRSQLFYKKAGDGETAWHQDHAFPGPLNAPSIDPPVTVTAWIALDEATPENGCVDFVVGSHKEGILSTVVDENAAGIFGRLHRLERVIDGTSPIAKMPVKPGQFFLFSNLTIHGSGPNTTDAPRLGLAARFAPTSVRVYPGLTVDGQGMNLDKYGCVLVRGEDRYGHNRMRVRPDESRMRDIVPLGTSYDAGFKIGYRVGYAKGERHFARGVRIEIADRDVVNWSVQAYSKEYDDQEAFQSGFKDGLREGYATGVEQRPYDTRFGAPVEGAGSGDGRGRGPLRRVFRLAKKVLRKFR